MALKGIKVLEFAGIAPGPFCGKILTDFGAEVTIIDKMPHDNFNVFTRGKHTLAIDLKNALGQKLIKQIICKYDVLIDPFRPGVMEKLNLGPEVLCKENPKLIYARLTGFGQSGPLAKRAGHDMNYGAISGVLSMLGREHERPYPPINLLADTLGGTAICTIGVLLALMERHHSGCGQVIDAAMVDGTAYMSSILFMSRNMPLVWGNKRGRNAFDGGWYYYDVYETKDGKYMSVAPMEPKFFDIFKAHLGQPQLEQHLDDERNVKGAKALVTAAFLQKTQAEWSLIFENIDACVYPIVEWNEVMKHKHLQARDCFQMVDGDLVPNPAPRLSRTPGKLSTRANDSSEAIEESLNIIRNLNLSNNELRELIENNVLILPVSAKL